MYDVGTTDVEVEFFGDQGDERVVAVASPRSFQMGGLKHLLYWLGGAVLCGWVAARLLPLRRPPPSARGALPVGATAGRE